MWVLPSDHHIGNEDEMDNALLHALPAARDGLLVTFGIRPTRPDTGYGYIRLGSAVAGTSVYRTQAFVEKPDRATATSYLNAGNYLWNSGMFLFSTAALLDEYRNHASGILETVAQAMHAAPHATTANATYYGTITEVPFDKAIMEKSVNVAVVPCDPSWSDIGSWESLWEIGEKDHNGNVILGNAVCENTRDCLIHAQGRLLTCAGLENMVIVDTGDAVLVAARSDGDAMRSLVKTLKNNGHVEVSHSILSTASLSAAA